MQKHKAEAERVSGVKPKYIRLPEKKEIRYFGMLALLTLAAGIIFYRSLIPAAAALPLYIATVERYGKWLSEKEKRELRNQFKDMLYSFSASFSSGRHMAEAMEEAVEALEGIYRGRCALSERLEYMLRQIRDTGDTDISVWEEFAARTNVAEIEEFTQVFRVCRDTGGDLIKAADRAASIITDKINIENEIRAMSAQKKTEGKLITVMPVVLILFLSVVSPEYIEPLYGTTAGRIVMTAVIIIMVFAYVLVERITAIEV